MEKQTVLTGTIVDEKTEFTLHELSRSCGKPAEWILALIDEGVIDPVGDKQAQWRFGAACLRRVRIVQRLECDLGVNLAGAALAVELLDEVERLRARLAAATGR